MPVVVPLAALADAAADRDADRVKNGDDSCPYAPGDKSLQGCPELITLDMHNGHIALKKSVKFEGAKIKGRSDPLLNEVAAVLAANLDYQVRVEAHTASDGDAAENLALSRERAQSVRDWLVQHDIAAERIHTVGCGGLFAIAPNNVDWGKKKNERIELWLLDRSASSSVPLKQGCSQSE